MYLIYETRGFLPGDIVHCSSVVPRQSANTLPGQVSCITRRAEERTSYSSPPASVHSFSLLLLTEMCIINLVYSITIKLNSILRRFFRVPERCHIFFHSKVCLIIGEGDLAKNIYLLNCHAMRIPDEV